MTFRSILSLGWICQDEYSMVFNQWAENNFNPYIFPKEVRLSHSLKKVEPFDLGPSYLAPILRTFQSVNPPHGQWPAPMGSWRVSYYSKLSKCHLRPFRSKPFIWDKESALGH